MKRNILLFFLVLIVCSIFVIFNLYFVNLSSGKNDFYKKIRIPGKTYIHSVCSCNKGDIKEYKIKNTNIIVRLICLGSMKNVFGTNKTLLLSNKNVLIYSDTYGDKVAEVYYPQTQTFSKISNGFPNNDTLVYPIKENFLLNNIDNYIKVSKDKYLLWFGVIYNEKSNQIETFSKEIIQAYKKFIETRTLTKDNYIVNVFNNKDILYAGVTNDSENRNVVFWLEDPINLTRSKYGQFKTDYENLDINDYSAQILKNGNIVIIGDTWIKLFNPSTGKILTLLQSSFRRNESIILPNENIFILDKDNNTSFIFNIDNNKITPMDSFINSKSISNKDIYEIKTKLNDKNILVKGANNLYYLFDFDTKSFIPIFVNENIKRNSSYTSLGNNKILITGGSSFTKHILDTGEMYNSAQLLIIDNQQGEI